MAKRLTMKELSVSIQRLGLEIQYLRRDFVRLENSLNAKFDTKIDGLYSLMDHYVKRTEDWRQEHIILKGRHDRVTNTLIQKNVITEQEVQL